MLIVETIARIRRDHLDRGAPIRQIARELKLSRNTLLVDVNAFALQQDMDALVAIADSASRQIMDPLPQRGL